VILGKRVQQFSSIAEAARHAGVSRPAISKGAGRGVNGGGRAVVRQA
jgi:hypothetical protein